MSRRFVRRNGEIIDLEERRRRRGVEGRVRELDELKAAMRDFERVRNHVMVCLLTAGLPSSYAALAAGDIAEGYVNGDVVPMWVNPAFESPNPLELRDIMEEYNLRLTRSGWLIEK